MKHSETFTGWLQAPGKVLGKEPVFSDDASCEVQFREDLNIQLAVNDDTGGFYIYAEICPFPKDVLSQYQLLQMILRFNLEQAQTLQGSFCLSEDNQSVLLSFARPVETFDAKRFVHAFLTFFDVCEAVRTALAQVVLESAG